MTIIVNNQANVSHTGSQYTISANAISADIDGVRYDLPWVVPNKAELDYSRSAGIPLNSPLFQYVHRTLNVNSLREAIRVERATDNYREYLNATNGLGDLYLQYPQSNALTDRIRHTSHQIQDNAGAQIISDNELDREQTVDEFERQIMDTFNNYRKHIVSPTLDLGILQENLFAEKLELLLDKGFKRFNVKYRSIPQNITNWIDLSQGIHGKDVWCNVVGVTPRWHRSSMASMISTVFLFGVHTVSMGYPWRGTPNAESLTFNRRTHRFNHARQGMLYANSRAVSNVGMQLESIDAREHIVNGTYYTQYIPSKQGLVRMLNSIA